MKDATAEEAARPTVDYFGPLLGEAFKSTLDHVVGPRARYIVALIAAAIGAGIYADLNPQSARDKAGAILDSAAGVFAVAVLVFLIHLLYLTPRDRWKAQRGEIVSLRSQIDNREAVRMARGRLWRQREEGVRLRNERVADNSPSKWRKNVDDWKDRYSEWERRLLSDARIVSEDLRSWLEILDTIEADIPNNGEYVLDHDHMLHLRCLHTQLSRLGLFLSRDIR